MNEHENQNNINNTSKEKINPWFNIWIEPRKTIRHIVNNDIKGFIIILAMLSGIIESFNTASSLNFGGTLNLSSTISVILISLFCIWVGSIVGILSLYIFSGLVKWTGKWLGGTATSDEIRASIAWGKIPFIMTSGLLIIGILVFGNDIRTNLSLVIIFGIIVLVGSIWALVVGLKCLSEVQGFSVWKALANEILAGLIILIPTLILIFIGLYGFLSYTITHLF